MLHTLQKIDAADILMSTVSKYHKVSNFNTAYPFARLPAAAVVTLLLKKRKASYEHSGEDYSRLDQSHPIALHVISGLQPL